MLRNDRMLVALIALGLAMTACGPASQIVPSAPAQPTSFAPPLATALPSTAAPGQPSPAPAGSLADLKIGLDPWLDQIPDPVAMADPGDGSGRLFVASRKGYIFVIKDGRMQPTLFLNLKDQVRTGYVEQGLLGLAFHPKFASNGVFFVYYTNPDGNNILSRFSVSSNPDVADPASEQILLTMNKTFPNHNGGQIIFGPDGYLYLGPGDGGGAGDPLGNGQNSHTILGKLLRINVDTLPYTIPPDNPFVGNVDFRPEIWAWGLRNPWRFTFDRQTGDLYIADVGQDAYEEIDFQPASSHGGENYGWPVMEGAHCYPQEAACSSQGYVLPVAEYTHEDSNCAVVGGYVYRGSRFPAMNGVYFFADDCSGTIWGMMRTPDGTWQTVKLLETDKHVSSFGEDTAGELYVLDRGGDAIFHLVLAGAP